MDLYLPDEFYALSEAPNARREAETAAYRDVDWLGGEAFLVRTIVKAQPADPDPIWLVV